MSLRIAGFVSLVVGLGQGCSSAPQPAAGPAQPSIQSNTTLELQIGPMVREEVVAELRTWIGWHVAADILRGPSSMISGTLIAVDNDHVTIKSGLEDHVLALSDLAAVSRESDAMHGPSKAE